MLTADNIVLLRRGYNPLVHHQCGGRIVIRCGNSNCFQCGSILPDASSTGGLIINFVEQALFKVTKRLRLGSLNVECSQVLHEKKQPEGSCPYSQSPNSDFSPSDESPKIPRGLSILTKLQSWLFETELLTDLISMYLKHYAFNL